MASNTEIVSIRLPEELVGKIDEIIEKLGFSQTRAEYITKSLDTYFRILITTRLSIDRQVKKLKEIQEIDPSTILAITKAAVEIYIKKYECYSGKKQQILLRVPVKMLKTIDSYQTSIGLYDNLNDYIRYAVSNQIESDEKLLEKMDRVLNHRIIQTRSTDEIVNSVINELLKPESDALEELVCITKLMIDESSKEKKNDSS